jgi:transcription initiation factor TFIID subunit 7
MKSWNKKDWVKTADVCQMLLVLGRVKDEDEAKKYPLPPEVDPHKHQYPHGLTPPMHWVRKRRFRPRQSYHEIEQREAKVNQLLAEDERARTEGGSTEYEIIDETKVDTEEESSEEDGEGEEEDIAETTEYVLEGQTEGGEEIEVDNSELAAALAAGLMEDEGDVDALFGGEEVELATPMTSHDVAVHALGENAVSAPETAASSPNAATSPDDDDDDDDDAQSDAEDEMDAQAAAAQEGLEQGMTEIRELEQEIAKAQEQLDSSNNVLYKQRCKRKIEQLQTDLGLKKAALGIADDGD